MGVLPGGQRAWKSPASVSKGFGHSRHQSVPSSAGACVSNWSQPIIIAWIERERSMPGGGQVHVADDKSGEQPATRVWNGARKGRPPRRAVRSGQRCPPIMAPVITCKGSRTLSSLK